jgi:hypothetical protein
MINIRREAEDVITGKQPRDNNVLKNAPHPMSVIALSEEEWNRCVNYKRCHRGESSLLYTVPIHVSKPLTHSRGSVKGSFGRLFRGWTMVGLYSIIRSVPLIVKRGAPAYGDTNLIVSVLSSCA